MNGAALDEVAALGAAEPFEELLPARMAGQDGFGGQDWHDVPPEVSCGSERMFA
jgi:hypothetical protein